MKATTTTIKSCLESRFKLNGIALATPLYDMGLRMDDRQRVADVLRQWFGPEMNINIDLSDTVNSIYDKINSRANEGLRHKLDTTL